jgi:hypothetical protein
MKKLVLIALTVSSVSILNAQIQMNSSGNVGIGFSSWSTKFETTSAYFWSNVYFRPSGGVPIVVGTYPVPHTSIYPGNNNYCTIGKSNQAFNTIYYYNYGGPSDYRQKENIKDLSNSLDKILKLKGVIYDLKKEFAYNDSLVKNEKMRAKLEIERKNKIGFIAQDVIKVLPSVVLYDDSTDTYCIDYIKVIPVLVEAIKEQQNIIKSLQSETNELKKITNNKLKSTSTNTKTDEILTISENVLYQNTPNPFSQATTIEYFLTDNVQNAMICIYDMNGTQLKCILLHLTGYGNITINGNELKAGMYMYSLITDGQLIDTKRMVLTD